MKLRWKNQKVTPPEGGWSLVLIWTKKGGGGSEIPKIRFVEFVIKETKKGVIERSLCPRKFIWSGLGLVYFSLLEDKNRGGGVDLMSWVDTYALVRADSFWGVKKCVEDAKIGTLRADWRGEWVSLGVDLLNIKKKWGGGGCHVVVNRQPPLEGKKPYHLCGGVFESL